MAFIPRNFDIPVWLKETKQLSRVRRLPLALVRRLELVRRLAPALPMARLLALVRLLTLLLP
jgi:hypothetical protein